MYKLGPVHQGIVERGSKTGSDSYILWPAKVGAFTVVSGRHYRNSDTSDLPFSYLIEHEDESVLVPGVNLRSVGTVRDARKWPSRDKRKNPDRLDMINFKLLSPYTIQKMLNGLALLRELETTSGEISEYYTYNNVKIEKNALEKGIGLYETGVSKFIGNCLIHRLQNRSLNNVKDLQEVLKPESDVGAGKWFDIAGLFVPEKVIEKLLHDIENDVIVSLGQVEQAFISMHENYPLYEWSWAVDILQKIVGKKIEEFTPSDIIELVTTWKHAVISLDNQLYLDAGKEYAATVQTGYGLDGDQVTKEADFAAVRGTFEKDSFVSEIENHIKIKTELANDLINRMKKLI